MALRDCEHPCDEHYRCRLLQNTSMVAPSATPSRYRHGKLRKPVAPSWEKGFAPTEKRPGGFEMPLLSADGTRMRVKEYGERRHEISRIRDRQRKAPSPSSS